MKVDKRQSIILVITLFAFAFLAFEAYQLVRNDISSAQTKPTPTPVIAQSQHSLTATPTFKAELPKSTRENHERLITHQQKYIDLVNQYEMAKMERQLLEEQVAIAQARQRIAELSAKTQPLADTNNTTASPIPTASAERNSNPAYQLTYLDHQISGYSATLNKNGNYYEVTPGYQLPDGVEVKQITHDSVLLQQNDRQFRLTFNGLAPLPQNNASIDAPKPKDAVDLTHIENKVFALNPTNHTPHTYTLDEILLLELPSTSYTILLKSDSDRHALVLFAQKNALGENAIYYSLPSETQKKYVLLYSYFNTRAEAEMALQRLSPTLKNHHPTVESIATIQDIIKAQKNEARG